MKIEERLPGQYLSELMTYRHVDTEYPNDVILKYLPEKIAQNIRQILATEETLAEKARERFQEREKAARAEHPDAAQQKLVRDHGLWRITPGRSLVTLGLNAHFNLAAQRNAVRKDFADLAREAGYNLNEGRAMLNKYKLYFIEF